MYLPGRLTSVSHPRFLRGDGDGGVGRVRVGRRVVGGVGRVHPVLDQAHVVAHGVHAAAVHHGQLAGDDELAGREGVLKPGMPADAELLIQ
mgnify:CR=1 FL=1